MPDEREEAIQELVAGWMRRARSDLALARLPTANLVAAEPMPGDRQLFEEFVYGGNGIVCVGERIA
jgi:hypothetical protein